MRAPRSALIFCSGGGLGSHIPNLCYDSVMNPGDLITKHFRLIDAQKKGLSKLGIETIRDLLYHFPSRYEEPYPHVAIKNLAPGMRAVVRGYVVAAKTAKTFTRRTPIGELALKDPTGQIKAVWYHQPYLAKKVPTGFAAELAGTLSERKGELYFANPEIRPVEAEADAALGPLFGSEPGTALMGVYAESRGISSSWLQHSATRALAAGAHAKIADPVPEVIRRRYHLPDIATTLLAVHAPRSEEEAAGARKRLAFDEVFKIQLSREQTRANYEESTSWKIPHAPEDLNAFIDRFPFPLTSAQKKAVHEITKDLKRNRPMMRLLEGDVGSGKTAVAAAAAFAAVRAGLEVAYMAPTEILAQQHFESFIKYFKHLGIQVGLMTSSECRKFPSKIEHEEHTHISRTQLLKWVANGEIPILIGTHSLMQKSVQFKRLGLVIIDEQHRFGVNQRLTLAKKRTGNSPLPHLLSMTATPIPRTLALTLYGDLDLTLLDEMPPGRKPVITKVIKPEEKTGAYQLLESELNAGRQGYVICPRIDEPDPTKEMALNAKSVTAETEQLKKRFPRFRVLSIHGKMKPFEKDAAMEKFLKHEADILVATSVIEVGVNVPNASVIIIEGSERFGLAQLHQLRGRVIRGTHQPYCFLFTDKKTGTGEKRLSALAKSSNGFALAEEDLNIRGAGSLMTGKQWGISDVGMEALANLKMVEAARREAQELTAKDPSLKNYPALKEALKEIPNIHFE